MPPAEVSALARHWLLTRCPRAGSKPSSALDLPQAEHAQEKRGEYYLGPDDHQGHRQNSFALAIPRAKPDRGPADQDRDVDAQTDGKDQQAEYCPSLQIKVLQQPFDQRIMFCKAYSE